MSHPQGTVLALYPNTGSIATPVYSVALEGEFTSNFTINMSEIDVTDKADNNWKNIIPGIRDASVSFTAHYDESQTATPRLGTDLLTAAQPLTKIQYKTIDSYTYSADAYITNLSHDAPHDGAVDISGTLTITGAITRA